MLSRLRARGGFTLVEVVLAIGVVAFAFVGLFALLPSGLSLFRQAMDTSMGSQISQQVVGEAEQADFDTLVSTQNPTGGQNNQFYTLPLRHFDDQGTELQLPTDGSVPAHTLYTVRTRGSLPGPPDPNSPQADYFTSLPATGSNSRYEPRSATILTVQVVKNPGRKSLTPYVDGTLFLITPAKAKANHLEIQTFSAVVARNGYTKPIVGP